MKRRFLFMVVLGLALCLNGAPAWGDGFYVIAGSGPSGKVLKTQVFTSNTTNETVAPEQTFTKLSTPQWTYTKLSATSYLVITYEDSLYCSGNFSQYYLRVNDQSSAIRLMCTDYGGWIFSSSTGVRWGLPKGDLNLSIWQYQSGCTVCQQCAGNWGTNVTVMEIEH